MLHNNENSLTMIFFYFLEEILKWKKQERMEEMFLAFGNLLL